MAAPFAAPARAATITTGGSFGAGAIAQVTFTRGPGGTWLDITTNGSTDPVLGGGADTEIALYAGTGPGATYVASANTGTKGDDGDGIGLASTRSQGVGSGSLPGDPFDLGGHGLAEGEDGPMPAANTDRSRRSSPTSHAESRPPPARTNRDVEATASTG